MTVANATRFLHVANGTSTTNTIQAAGIPGARSIWADPLYEGPVPGGLTDDELLDVRRRFLAELLNDVEVDPTNDLRRWRQIVDAHQSYDELVLWFEHDLFDQLNLVQILTRIWTRLPPTTVVSLVCIGAFPGRPTFRGLGELTPDELASLFDTRQPVRDAEYALAERAWRSFLEPTPETLDRLRHTDMTALPYLATAVARFLQEYPWTTDGLSRTERRLLFLAEAGPLELLTAFPRMHEGEDAYYITDRSLASLAATLSQTSPPLMCISRPVADGDALHGSVTLTDTGRAVLAGRYDRITVCGIDRWLGGVHLQGHADVWRWDETHQKVTRP